MVHFRGDLGGDIRDNPRDNFRGKFRDRQSGSLKIKSSKRVQQTVISNSTFVAHDDRSNEQPEFPSSPVNPITPWSTTSAGDLRNAPTRRSPNASQKRPTLEAHTPPISDGITSLITVPCNVIKRLDVSEGIDKRRKKSEPSTPNVNLLHTQSPPFGVPNRREVP